MEEYNKYTLRNLTYITEVPTEIKDEKTAIIRVYDTEKGAIKEKRIKLESSAEKDCFGKVCLTATDSNKLEETLLDLVEGIDK